MIYCFVNHLSGVFVSYDDMVFEEVTVEVKKVVEVVNVVLVNNS